MFTCETLILTNFFRTKVNEINRERKKTKRKKKKSDEIKCASANVWCVVCARARCVCPFKSWFKIISHVSDMKLKCVLNFKMLLYIHFRKCNLKQRFILCARLDKNEGIFNVSKRKSLVFFILFFFASLYLAQSTMTNPYWNEHHTNVPYNGIIPILFCIRSRSIYAKHSFFILFQSMLV